MKKFEILGKKLSKDEQKQVRGGDPPGGCIEEYGYDCAKDQWPGGTCCPNLHCEVNGTSTGTLCMPNT